jgi:hypothetical protein
MANVWSEASFEAMIFPRGLSGKLARTSNRNHHNPFRVHFPLIAESRSCGVGWKISLQRRSVPEVEAYHTRQVQRSSFPTTNSRVGVPQDFPQVIGITKDGRLEAFPTSQSGLGR